MEKKQFYFNQRCFSTEIARPEIDLFQVKRFFFVGFVFLVGQCILKCNTDIHVGLLKSSVLVLHDSCCLFFI